MMLAILIFATLLPNNPPTFEQKARAAIEGKLGIPPCNEALFESRPNPENDRACRVNFLANSINGWIRWDLADFKDNRQVNETYEDVQHMLKQLSELDRSLGAAASGWVAAWRDRLLAQNKAAEELRHQDEACSRDTRCNATRARKALTSTICRALEDLSALDRDLAEIRHDAKLTGVFDVRELYNLGQERRLTILQITNLKADYLSVTNQAFADRQCR